MKLLNLQSLYPTIPRSEKQLFLKEILKINAAEFILNPERLLNEKEQELYKQYCKRRINSEPVAYILGKKEFFGHQFSVTPDVLIPRPETEQIIELLKKACTNSKKQIDILDVGTGSGILAITSALELQNATITALDISSKALTVASKNAEYHKVADKIKFIESDLLTKLPSSSTFGYILANLPYIGRNEINEMAIETQQYEPELALYSDNEDGMQLYATLFNQIKSKNVKFTNIICEIGYKQASKIQELAKSTFGLKGFMYNDLANIPRIFSLHQI